MSLPEQRVLLQGLRRVQRTLCAYDMYPSIPENACPPGGCDCKFGATNVARSTETGNGCPEVATAIAVLEALLPTEWEIVRQRMLRPTPNRAEAVVDVTTIADRPETRRFRRMPEFQHDAPTSVRGPLMDIRKVVFNDKAGVYLGPGAGTSGFWSLVNPGGLDAAPTFANEAQVEEHAKLYQMEMREYRLVEVHPDRPDSMASAEACVNATLPRWDPNGQGP